MKVLTTARNTRMCLCVHKSIYNAEESGLSRGRDDGEDGNSMKEENDEKELR